MGTRAQFFIGNPEDVAGREWLGCVAWDGYPNGDCGDALRGCNTPDAFRAGVEQIASVRDDFTDPELHSFPFPWRDDLYLTDVTFALIDGEVRATYFHHGWRPLEAFFDGDGDPYGEDAPDELPSNVPAPQGDKPHGPDSIMVVTLKSAG